MFNKLTFTSNFQRKYPIKTARIAIDWIKNYTWGKGKDKHRVNVNVTFYVLWPLWDKTDYRTGFASKDEATIYLADKAEEIVAYWTKNKASYNGVLCTRTQKADDRTDIILANARVEYIIE